MRAGIILLGIFAAGETLCASGCRDVPGCNGRPYCVTFEDYCTQLDEAVRCTQPQVCGVAASDVSCDDIRPWPQSAPLLPCPGALGASIDAGLVVFDPGAAGDALHRLTTQCGALLDPRTIFVGARRTGTACNGLQCVEGTYCEESIPGQSSCGLCEVASGPGASVAAPEACATDTYVWSPDAGFVCADFVDDGGPCSSGVGSPPCAPTLSCQPTGGGASACLPWPGLGAACATDAECGVNLCRGLPLRCVAWAGRGEACASAPDPVLPLCKLGYACVPASSGENQCGDRIPAGGSCVTDPNGCVANTRCGAGDICLLLGERGAGCATDQDCQAGLVCNSAGNCDKARVEGDSCLATPDCASGFFCDQLACTWAPCIP